MLKDLLNEELQKTIKTYTVKPEKMEMPEMDEKNFPCIHLGSDVLPEIKDWEVEEEYFLLLKVKQTSKSMFTEGKEEKYNGSFEIREVAVIDKKDDEKEESKDNSMKQVYGV